MKIRILKTKDRNTGREDVSFLHPVPYLTVKGLRRMMQRVSEDETFGYTIGWHYKGTAGRFLTPFKKTAMGEMLDATAKAPHSCCERADLECYNESGAHDSIFTENYPFPECRDHACGETLEGLEQARSQDREDYVYGTGQGT